MTSWQLRALYRRVSPALFYPDAGVSARRAKEICAACPVRRECLDYAVANREPYGICGGLSEKERRKLARHAA